MKRDKAFHDYVVHDLLGDIPNLKSKAMFSGWGIYKDGVIFGIIADGQLWFKVGASNLSDFKEFDSRPFKYSRKDGKEIEMSYWLIPEEIMENRGMLHELVEKSVQVNIKS